MKTPEQLAVEWLKEEYGDTSNWTYMGQEMSLDAFYAGYQAGRLNSEGVQAAKDYNEDTLLAAFKAGSQSGNNVMPGLSGYIPADFNDFLLSLPAKDQVANVSKVMFCVYCNDMHKGNCAIGKGKNHPAFGFSEIVVKIESSWVSVKERLPEDGIPVLAFVFDTIEVGYIETLTTDDYEFHWIGDHNYIDKGHRAITHWMPLPAAPKE